MLNQGETAIHQLFFVKQCESITYISAVRYKKGTNQSLSLNPPLQNPVPVPAAHEISLSALKVTQENPLPLASQDPLQVAFQVPRLPVVYKHYFSASVFQNLLSVCPCLPGIDLRQAMPRIFRVVTQSLLSRERHHRSRSRSRRKRSPSRSHRRSRSR